MCTYVDDKVGRLLDTLADLGIEDDTVVVFTADHGEMLGERGQWFKQSFHEWSVRVPLIVRIPGLQSAPRVPELVSLVDLLPTFMDIATEGDAPEPVTPMDGHSLVSLMRGQTAWRNQVVSEYTGEGVCAPCRMVRRDNVKFIYTHGHPDLMFDLDADPLELDSVIGRAGYAAIESTLREEVLRDWDPERIRDACIQSQKERMFIHGSTAGEPGYAYEHRAGDGQRFVRNASAVGAKARARYPFVEPTPFVR